MVSAREIKLALNELGIRPNRALGQNFLIDKNIQNKILVAAKLNRDSVVLEIGPGLGGLTWELCKKAKSVIAIEKDRLLCKYLSSKNEYKNLELICQDALKYDFNVHNKLKVVSNLPYYITSPIIVSLIENRRAIESAYIMVQKEVANRLIARPGTKDFASISCFIQFYANVAPLFTIKRSCFYPEPKVDSTFLEIVFYERALYLTDEEKLFKIIRACFGKRRKTVLNSLCASGIYSSKKDVLEVLNKIGIQETRRP